MKRKILAITAAAGVVAGSSLFFATPASADLVTRCVGEGGAVTVPGDLVVPANQVCTLTGTTVEGSIRVAAGADLVLNDVTVTGDVRGSADSYIEGAGSSVAGAVVLRGAFGAYLEGTSVAGQINTAPAGDVETGGFVLTADATVGGNVVSRSGEVLLETSDVAGNVVSTDSYYTDLYESWVDGTLTVRDNELGGIACAVSIGGRSVYSGNGDVVQLGSDGPFTSCEGSSYWGGNVTASDNAGGVYVDNNIVNGDLSLTGNDPVAQVGANNRVRGSVSGEFEEWTTEEAPAPQMRTLAKAEEPETRKASLESKIADRGADAVDAAEEVGPADL